MDDLYKPKRGLPRTQDQLENLDIIGFWPQLKSAFVSRCYAISPNWHCTSRVGFTNILLYINGLDAFPFDLPNHHLNA